MEQHYVARLEFLCPRGFGVQVSLGLCMQNTGTYCTHFCLFPKINSILCVLIKRKRSLWIFFSSKILTAVITNGASANQGVGGKTHTRVLRTLEFPVSL